MKISEDSVCKSYKFNSLKEIGGAKPCPALYKIRRVRKDLKEVAEFKPHPILVKLFAPSKHFEMTFHATELPMLAPPQPRQEAGHGVGGGYLLHPTEIVRMGEIKGGLKGHYMSEVNQRLEKAKPMMDSLNLLSSTPWKVNQPVLDVVIAAFSKPDVHGAYLKDLSVPRHPSSLKAPEMSPAIKAKLSAKVKLSAEEMAEYKEFLVDRQAFNQHRRECYSLWCDMLYKLSIANHFRDEVLFFPHNVDFRGRVYPVPPHLNHMGNDIVRSLLVFAEGKPLGPKGLDWLKTHVINLTGEMKKSPVRDRLAHANEILDDIVDSAEDPFGGKKWWLKSETPLQTLSACFEIRNALKCPQGPENFVSHLPIHQDGSCNGLQHYAALGRDVLGAKSVNLVPGLVTNSILFC